MKKFQLYSLVIILLLVLSACTNNNESTTKSPAESFTYEEYNDLFSKMNKSLHLPGYQLVESTSIKKSMIAIDKELSFGKREILTVDGNQNSNLTQERLIYKSDDSSRYTLLDIIFNDEYIGKDLLLWPQQTDTTTSIGYLKRYDTALLAYKNVLVQITSLSENKSVNPQEMEPLIKAVTSFLKDQ